MKSYIINKCFNTKAKADNALIQLGVTPPKCGGLSKRHELLMAFPFKKLKAIAYV